MPTMRVALLFLLLLGAHEYPVLDRRIGSNDLKLDFRWVCAVSCARNLNTSHCLIEFLGTVSYIYITLLNLCTQINSLHLTDKVAKITLKIYKRHIHRHCKIHIKDIFIDTCIKLTCIVFYSQAFNFCNIHDDNPFANINIMAAFRGMHVSPANIAMRD